MLSYSFSESGIPCSEFLDHRWGRKIFVGSTRPPRLSEISQAFHFDIFDRRPEEVDVKDLARSTTLVYSFITLASEGARPMHNCLCSCPALSDASDTLKYTYHGSQSIWYRDCIRGTHIANSLLLPLFPSRPFLLFIVFSLLHLPKLRLLMIPSEPDTPMCQGRDSNEGGTSRSFIDASLCLCFKKWSVDSTNQRI